jgi:hypothetical protein
MSRGVWRGRKRERVCIMTVREGVKVAKKVKKEES